MNDMNLQGPRLSRGGALWLLGTLSLLMGFASIATDIYLPAMPEMASYFGTGVGMMEFTVSAYLVGFSIGQLAWGPIGDRFGRRVPTAVGIAMFALGSAGCAMSTSPEMLIGWRLVQALGASAAVVLSRAMVRDLYSGERAAQMLSTLITVMALAPLLGPIVGGQILRFAPWQAVFWTLVGVGLITVALTLSLPETLSQERRNRESVRNVIRRYFQLLSHPQVLALTGAGAFYYVGMFAYVAGSPFAYVDYFGVSPQQYSLFFAAGIISIMGFNIINAKFVGRFGMKGMLRVGTLGGTMAAVLALSAVLAGLGGVWGMFVGVVSFAGMAGLIVANSLAGAMELLPERSGAVSALVGAIQYGSGMVGSALVGIFADGSPIPMTAIMLVSGIGAAICAFHPTLHHFMSGELRPDAS